MQGIIQAVSTKEVKTRFGVKNTYSINVDGTWYSNNFKVAPNKGSEVEFNVKSTKWGEEVDGDISVLKAAAGGEAVSAAAAPKSSGGAAARPKGNFPIAPMDGQRSIIRQNSLTQANAYVRHQDTLGAQTVEDMIAIAKQFEAYSAGDLDAAAAKKIALRKKKEAAAAAAKAEAEAAAERAETDLDDDDLLPMGDDTEVDSE